MRLKLLPVLLGLAVMCLNVQLAHACWHCASGGGYPSCQGFSVGAEVCVTSDDPPYCSTYFNDCYQQCLRCDPGCCAGFKGGKGGPCSKVVRIAFPQDAKPDGQYHDHFQEFLDMVEKGAFDGKTIYTDSISSIGKGLLNTPVDHWRSFSQEVVLKGGKDKPANVEKGKPMRILHIETKTGHKLTVHLADPATMQRMRQGSSQPTPTSRDSL